MAFSEEKKRVAEKALQLIEPGMRVGIGTGSTIAFFIDALRKRQAKENLDIICVATSLASQRLLGKGFVFQNDALPDEIDITFDGADRVDPKTFCLIKGGGGALLREKLVALSSKRNIVLVDHSKVSSPLQGFPVAVEIVPFGWESTVKRINKRGYKGSLRLTQNKPFLTDNRNMIFDIDFKGPIIDPVEHHNTLKMITGVIETGLFFDTATELFIGESLGNVTHLAKKRSDPYL